MNRRRGKLRETFLALDQLIILSSKSINFEFWGWGLSVWPLYVRTE